MAQWWGCGTVGDLCCTSTTTVRGVVAVTLGWGLPLEGVSSHVCPCVGGEVTETTTIIIIIVYFLYSAPSK